MLVIGDYKHLEWDTCVYLSQDPAGIEELFANGDMHSDNERKFGLPSRLIAKKFLFRLIFGGSGPSYAGDPEFSFVSDKASFWNGVIDSFYQKYTGVRAWHERLMVEVMDTGRITLPTGLFFPFSAYQNRKGDWVFPRTKILNYPVQGLGAQLMVIARVLMRREMKAFGLRGVMVCTVHDSILIDCPNNEVETVCQMFQKVWNQIAPMFYNLYGVEYNLPCRVEVKYGPNWKDMEEYEDKAA